MKPLNIVVQGSKSWILVLVGGLAHALRLLYSLDIGITGEMVWLEDKRTGHSLARASHRSSYGCRTIH